MQKLRKQNGITLIALIITIIVMLILVGVSVTVALNGGLFSTAQNAAEGTKIAGEKERLLSIALGALNDEGIVNFDKLEDVLDPAEFTLNKADKTITSIKTGKTYVVGERGSVTLPAEGGSAVTFTVEGGGSLSDLGTSDIGTVVTASNDEEFYYIGTENGKVKLLAAKCVNTSTWKQDDNYNTVAFDAATNIYANASIRGLVETYVTETLGLEANDGRLMLEGEATALVSEHEEILYGTSPTWNYWLGSPCEYDSSYAWCVGGAGSTVVDIYVGGGGIYGLRPVIEISLSNIG